LLLSSLPVCVTNDNPLFIIYSYYDPGLKYYALCACKGDGCRRISGCGGEGLVSKTDQMNRPSDL
jgi:hypothetical protein